LKRHAGETRRGAAQWQSPAEPNGEIIMTPDIASRPDTTTQIISLTRFVVLCTLALAAVLLVADFLGRGWSTADLRFLSEKVVIAIVYGIAAEVIAAVAAVTCMALWK
jgi:hypothetical protein